MAVSRWCAAALRAPVQSRAERRRCRTQAAMVGFLVHINHITFPGQIGQGVTFESLSQMGPFEAWSGLPMWGQAQIIAAIGGLELS